MDLGLLERAAPPRDRSPAEPPRPVGARRWPYALSWVSFFLFWPRASSSRSCTSRLAPPLEARRALEPPPLAARPREPPLLGTGAVGYASGTGRLMLNGLPGPEFRNLDRELRCRRVSMGCVIDGSEIFTQEPNNLAITLLTRAFGPMPGAYRGAYPSREEARAAVAAAPIPSASPATPASILAIPGARASSGRRPDGDREPLSSGAATRTRPTRPSGAGARSGPASWAAPASSSAGGTGRAESRSSSARADRRSPSTGPGEPTERLTPPRPVATRIASTGCARATTPRAGAPCRPRRRRGCTPRSTRPRACLRGRAR